MEGGSGQRDLREFKQGRGRRLLLSDYAVGVPHVSHHPPSRCPSISVEQPTEDGFADHRAVACIHLTMLWRITIERLVRARRVVVVHVLNLHRQQVPLAQGDDVVQALAPQRADEPLHVRVLTPRVPVCSRPSARSAHSLPRIPRLSPLHSAVTATAAVAVGIRAMHTSCQTRLWRPHRDGSGAVCHFVCRSAGSPSS